jgi:hypothetical protein
MSTRVDGHFFMEMQNEETLGGRLAKLPFGIMFMILLTGALSYYFERNPPVQRDLAATEQAIKQQIAQHEAGKSGVVAVVPTSKSRWYLFGGAALVMEGAAGIVVFSVIKRRRTSSRARRSRL